jgi:uncharacterized protein (TIGR03437 family)
MPTGPVLVTARELGTVPPFSSQGDQWRLEPASTGSAFVAVFGPLFGLTGTSSLSTSLQSIGDSENPTAAVPLVGGSFTMTGTGTVAGFPNVSITFTGTIDLEGNISGDYVMGAGGELPGGQAITYRLTGQFPVPPGTPMMATSRRVVQFRAAPGENPANQQLSITNIGSGELGWSADIGAGLTSVPGGTLTPGGIALSYAAGVAPTDLEVAVDTDTLAQGNYSGRITFSGLPTGAVPNSPQQVDVEVSVGTPVLFDNGVVEGAGFIAGRPVSAGGIVSGFGIEVANGVGVADDVPLPRAIDGASISLDTDTGSPALARSSGRADIVVDVPLFFVSGDQINFQVPWELEGVNQAVMTAHLDGAVSFDRSLQLQTYAPGIFTTTQAGTGQGAILIANTDTLVAPAGSIPGRESRPAGIGEFITIFCSGLGPVTNRPETGAVALSDPLSATVTSPTVTIGGVDVAADFSGLAPGFVGLYQVNVPIPQGVTPGPAVPVSLTIGGVTSNTATIAVQ